MRRFFWAVGLAWTVAAAAAPVAARFSAELSPAERTACGIDRLTSDEVASLDALVRRQGAVKAKAGKPAAFSQRLRPGEKHAAGLDRLRSEELSRLDAVVARKSSPTETSAELTDFATFANEHPLLMAGFPTAGAIDAADVAGPRPQIHGEMRLEFGFGRGHSERSAGLELDYDDPAHGFSASLDYEVSRIQSRRPVLPPSFDPFYHGPMENPEFGR